MLIELDGILHEVPARYHRSGRLAGRMLTERISARSRPCWTSARPRYVFRGPAMGPLASGPGMTVAPCRTHDLGG
ncbi:hypothetical protein ACFU99_09325, partial [Streptomyces sp. NPDC057654]|uniref:hypothetical protein n=1 Tax=Streptomyces sp. NPDC057654 TaxID=3346196 RepID=UPI0036A05A4A